MFKHIRAVVLLPGTVTLVVPAAILYFTGTVDVGWSLGFPLNVLPAAVGAGFIGLGLWLMAKTIGLFIRLGGGTLAPWAPTCELVVQGPYRRVRNPMISGVFFILLGEAVLVGSLPLSCWLLFFVLINAFYIPLFEEPRLVQRFGDRYVRYKKHVPRWIPHIKPWMDQAGDEPTIAKQT